MKALFLTKEYFHLPRELAKLIDVEVCSFGDQATVSRLFAASDRKLRPPCDKIGQWDEWNHEARVQWHQLAAPPQRGLQRWVRDLNTFCRGEPALHQLDTDAAGFASIDCNNAERRQEDRQGTA